MSGNPGNALKALSPTPPERGSFPLDHFGECKEYMVNYLKCMNLTKGENAYNCRILAKNYLNCRMDHELMERDDWENLGLPTDGKTTTNDKNKNEGKKFGESK